MQYLALVSLVALAFSTCSHVSVKAAPYQKSEGDNLAPDLDQLWKTWNPKNLALVNQELTEVNGSESAAFEGDLSGLDKELFRVMEKTVIGWMTNATSRAKKKWTAGVVPYEIGHSFRRAERKQIVEAMSNIQENTCVRFKRRTNEDDSIVHVLKGFSRCSSEVGRKGGRQIVLLSDACMSPGIILHELMHMLGFYHEHVRVDRDDYVEINHDNIAQENEVNFQKYNEKTFGHPYDYGSVMHYKTNEFAKDPKKWTVRPVEGYSNVVIGQREGLSKWDVQKINKLYNCEEARKSVCGYLWTKPDFQGFMTVIYEGIVEGQYKGNKRAYASAKILPGFAVLYHTEDSPKGVAMVGRQYRRFQPGQQSKATRLQCMPIEE